MARRSGSRVPRTRTVNRIEMTTVDPVRPGAAGLPGETVKELLEKGWTRGVCRDRIPWGSGRLGGSDHRSSRSRPPGPSRQPGDLAVSQHCAPREHAQRRLKALAPAGAADGGRGVAVAVVRQAVPGRLPPPARGSACRHPTGSLGQHGFDRPARKAVGPRGRQDPRDCRPMRRRHGGSRACSTTPFIRLSAATAVTPVGAASRRSSPRRWPSWTA